ncbi:phosphatidylinositol-binding protein scs2 [Orbilia ellipsospora]|uniref:Phosphatidylinositol-binding protein scs2 n=1 Tax=Orbilia ellipsospora TaxID=2528407 RepID=A0AAV9XVN7_9PEZI
MSVELHPSELGFRRPFDRETVQKLYIKNPNPLPVAFKVKTTAPKQYCVRPNSGRIEAGQDVEVAVLLQAMREDPPLDFRCRDKFLVQSVAITADQEFANISSVWQSVEKTAKDQIQEKKIRVTYLPPAATVHHNGEPEAQKAKSPSPPPYTSPSPDSKNLGPKADNSSSRDNVSETDAEPTEAHENIQPIVQTVADQLAEAKAQIVTLTKQLKESAQQKNLGELATGAKEKVAAGVTNIGRTSQAPEGVPVQLAAALCLAAFLLAYFFF